MLGRRICWKPTRTVSHTDINRGLRNTGVSIELDKGNNVQEANSNIIPNHMRIDKVLISGLDHIPGYINRKKEVPNMKCNRLLFGITGEFSREV